MANDLSWISRFVAAVDSVIRPGSSQSILGGAGEFEPPRIAGLVGWYQAAGAKADDSDNVTLWPDKTSQANDLEPGTSPTLVASDSDFNGRPSVQFVSGSDEYLENAAFDLGSDVAGITIGMVAKDDGSSNASRWAQYVSQGIIMRNTNDPHMSLLVSGAVTAVGTSDLGSARFVWARVTPGTSHSVGSGDSAEDTETNSAGAIASGSGFTVGAGANGASPASISVAELLVYNRAISDSEVISLSAYAASLYGTPR